jgi:hypothetical protein
MNLAQLNRRRLQLIAAVAGTTYEPETVALMTAIGWADDNTVSPHNGLTYSQVYGVVDNYFKAGKTGGYQSLLKAVYLFIGNTADNHKWNAMNPQDTDAAFRMLWFGSGVHSATGFKPNGTNAYGNTSFIENQNVALNNVSYGFYSRTNIDAAQIDMGAEKGTTYAYLYSNLSGNIYYRLQNTSLTGVLTSDSLGFYAVNRRVSNDLVLQKNSTINHDTLDGVSLGNYPYWIGARNATNKGFSTREHAYTFMGEGLTDTQMTTHYNAVQQLQNALGRQV